MKTLSVSKPVLPPEKLTFNEWSKYIFNQIRLLSVRPVRENEKF